MSFTDIDSPGSFLGSSAGSSSMDSLGGSGGGLSPQEAAELQQFVVFEQEKAKMRAQVQAMTDMCWDKCMGTPGNKLDGKTETCLDNCAQRFVDVSLFITNRFATLLQRQAQM